MVDSAPVIPINTEFMKSWLAHPSNRLNSEQKQALLDAQSKENSNIV